MTELDPTTGLPVLPEGYRWRVSFSESDYDLWPYMSILLQKKGRLFWHKVEGLTWALGYTKGEKLDAYARELKVSEQVSWRGTKYLLYAASEYPDMLRNMAENVLLKQQWTLKYKVWRDEHNASIEDLVGNYPPKKLGS